LISLAVGALFAGYTVAQTSSTPAPATTQTPASGTPTAKAQTGTSPAGTPGTKTPAAKTPAKPGTRPPFTPKTEKEKQSYAIGLNIGTSVSKGMKKDGVDVDPSVLVRGFKDGMTGAKALMTDDEINATLTTLRVAMKKKQDEEHKEQEAERKEQEAKLQAMGATNKSEGEAFLAANKAKDGVVTLPSGLQYKILTPGTGPKPTAADTVVCNYRGTLLNGTEFDASAKHGGPATFGVGQVIKGWTEALQLMPVGSKWQLFVPADLAYGGRSAGPDIGPNSTLIFEVELLSIQPKPEPTPAPAAAAPPAGSTPAAAPASAPPPPATPKPAAAPAPVTPPPTKP
jgi:FKBP-type peptidyl-prolyl cis-trans isomerase